MRHAITSLLLLVTCVTDSARAADDYPAKPIQMIVPFPAGGPADIVGRLYAQRLSAAVGQPVVTLNRDGRAGRLHPRLRHDEHQVVNPLVMKNVPYDF